MASDARIVRVTGRALPLTGNDIDTDRIIPARFLRSITFEGLEKSLFGDDRKQDRNHPFNQPQFQGAKILLVNKNFGCGSSREHAPQAIARWGIGAVIGESFAEIFFGNGVAIGLPCATMTSADVQALMSLVRKEPTTELTLDLEAQEVRAAGKSWSAQIPDGARNSFRQGTWDATRVLLEAGTQIEAVGERLPYVKGY